MRTLSVLLAVLFAACSFVAATSADDCPASLYWYFYRSSGAIYSTDSPTLDASFSVAQWDSARITFDRSLARLSLSTWGALSAGVRLVERFSITGVPPGTPVPATLVYTLNGSDLTSCGGGGCGVYYSGTVQCGSDSVSADADLPGPGTRSGVLSATLTLPVVLVAGAPLEAAFTLQYHTTWVGWGTSEGTGTYAITGLPAGVRAITCVGADVTPVRRSSWGGVKTLYR